MYTVLFFLNPIPVYYQHARYWLLSVLARVVTPGYSRVEASCIIASSEPPLTCIRQFIAFFVADELNRWVFPGG